jgi:UDP-GlcNAc:undecaprenyl-phosphate GlcNAc-1-phosphate transferase
MKKRSSANFKILSNRIFPAPESSSLIQLVLIFVLSFLITALFTPFAIKISNKLGILDYPSDPELKIHKRPMPLLGGTGIAAGIFISFVAIGILFDNSQRILIGLISALLIILVFGLLDDIKDIKPFLRLFGQIWAACTIIFISKIVINLFPFWYISIPLTILCLIASVNAINLLDGIDGLATGITLIASVGFFAVFVLRNDSLWAALSLALAGVTGAFLLFNFHPAKIFLGDNGSTFLGLYLGVLAVRFVSEPYSLKHLLVPALILIVPIIDISLAIGRRLLKHQPLSSGDRGHYYDKLIKKGYSQKQASSISYVFGILGASLAVLIILIK